MEDIMAIITLRYGALESIGATELDFAIDDGLAMRIDRWEAALRLLRACVIADRTRLRGHITDGTVDFEPDLDAIAEGVTVYDEDGNRLSVDTYPGTVELHL